MSMVTLGDAIANTNLGWLVSAKAEVSYGLGYKWNGGQALHGNHKLMVIIGWLMESNRYEWVTTPFGFDYTEGFTGGVRVSIKMVGLTPEQKAELALASVKQYGYWAWEKEFREMWPVLDRETKLASKGMLMAWAKDNLNVEFK